MLNFGRAALRTVENIAKGYSATEVLVRDATSNAAWGPKASELEEIARLTFNALSAGFFTNHPTDSNSTHSNAFVEIMGMLEKKLNEKGKNWRQVFKSLVVVDYLLINGSENVVLHCRDRTYVFDTLREFYYVDDNWEDLGRHVRGKAQDIAEALKDEKIIRDRRRHDVLASKRDRSLHGWDDSTSAGENSNVAPSRHSEEDRFSEEERDLHYAIKLSKEEEALRNSRIDSVSNLNAIAGLHPSRSAPPPRSLTTPTAGSSTATPLAEPTYHTTTSRTTFSRSQPPAHPSSPTSVKHQIEQSGPAYLPSAFGPPSPSSSIASMHEVQQTLSDPFLQQLEYPYLPQEQHVKQPLAVASFNPLVAPHSQHANQATGALLGLNSFGVSKSEALIKAEDNGNKIETTAHGNESLESVEISSLEYLDLPASIPRQSERVAELFRQSGIARFGNDHDRHQSTEKATDITTMRFEKKHQPGKQGGTIEDNRISALDIVSQAEAKYPPIVLDMPQPQSNPIPLLGMIFNNHERYQRLLRCANNDAQVILERFQVLLDSFDLTNEVRKQIVTAMQRLAAKTNSFPSYFFIHGSISLASEYAINSGSFGDIYKATWNNETLCLKVLRANQAILQKLAKSFAKEAILWSQLSHPNVLPFYGLYIVRSQLSFVSPWAENGCIMDYLNTEPTGISRILLCLDTALGVEYLHTKGVIHGDLKSANVLVDRSGRAYLADFGLSNIDDPQIIHWTSQSSVASKGGSVRWQAPELHRDEADDGTEHSIVHNTEMSDVYAWGCLCYEIFTGRVPFHQIRLPSTVMLRIIEGQTPLRPKDDEPAWLKHGLTSSLWQLMKDCWKLDPMTRPDMHIIISRIKLEAPASDPRPPSQWPAGSAMRFRNSDTTNPITHYSEDLSTVLSRVTGVYATSLAATV